MKSYLLAVLLFLPIVSVAQTLSTLSISGGELDVSCNMCPSEVCTAPSYICCTQMIAPISILSWSNVAVTVSNIRTPTYSSAPIESVLVQFSADSVWWEDTDKSMSGLDPGQTRSVNFAGNGRAFVRVLAGSCATPTYPAHAEVWVTANNG